MCSAKLAVAGLLALSSLAAPAATTITVTDLPIDRGGTVRIAHARPDFPKATIIWATGGNGVINIMPDGSGDNPNYLYNIPYGTRQLFVDRGYSVVYVDVATPQLPDGIDMFFRASNAHLSEWRAVLNHVRQRDDLPTWVIGFSAGSVSAVNSALNLPAEQPWGMVLLNSATNTQPSPSVLDFNLPAIRRPVLVVSHAEDPCPYTPPALAALVPQRLTGASALQHIVFTGGQSDQRPIECDSLGHHGLAGQYQEFVTTVVDWTTKNAHLASTPNYTGLWYNFPAESESGWGINFTHQGNTIFATLFTYDAGGAPLWLVMSAGSLTSGTTYSGTLYRTRGPAFNASPFVWNPATDLSTVGAMTVNFTAADRATLTYAYNGVTVTKTVMKQVYGSRAANCVPTTGSRASLTHYQDLWYNSPAESEPGWGVNVTHQDNTLFATLFTYDATGRDLWLVMSSGQRQADGSYLGDLYRTTGPAFNSNPFTPIGAGNLTTVGNMRFRFTDGSNGTLTYTYQGATVTKPITRQMFANPVPSCS